VGESVDARTDVFSLGTVAYRLITGRDAFGAVDPREILAQVVYDTPPAPSSLNPDLPPGGDAMIAHALAKSRKDRYENARSLAEDVEDLLAGRPPRYAEGYAWVGGTERFRAGLVSAAQQSVSEPALQSAASQSGSTRVGRRRSNMRGLAGMAALGLVLAIELLRRGEASSTAAVPAAVPPASSPDSSGESRLAPVFDPTLPSVNPPAPEAGKARLWLDIRHPLTSGRLRVFVDGTKVVDQGIQGRKATGILGVAMREGRARRSLDVLPGRRRIVVEVLWDDERRSRTAVGTFKPGGTMRLSARLSRLGKNLALEWQ
jgi:hypothetical protein